MFLQCIVRTAKCSEVGQDVEVRCVLLLRLRPATESTRCWERSEPPSSVAASESWAIRGAQVLVGRGELLPCLPQPSGSCTLPGEVVGEFHPSLARWLGFLGPRTLPPSSFFHQCCWVAWAKSLTGRQARFRELLPRDPPKRRGC